MKLGEAWAEWDWKPGHPDRAFDMEDTCTWVAEMFGVTATQVRAWLAEQRRAGLLPSVIVKDVADTYRWWTGG